MTSAIRSPRPRTEYRYALNTPSSHRYRRIVQSAGSGLTSGRGMRRMVPWTAPRPPADGIVWGDAPGDSRRVDAAHRTTWTAGPSRKPRAPSGATSLTLPTLSGDHAVLGFDDADPVSVLLQGATLVTSPMP